MKSKKQTHALLLLLVGGYIWYIAYMILQNQIGDTPEMSRLAAVLLIAFFILAGTGVFVYAWKVWKKDDDDDNNKSDDSDVSFK